MSSSKSTPITLSSLTHLHPTSVAPMILDPTERPKVAIIDVRDSDHIGGNINGSTWIPLNQLDARIPELVRTLKDKDRVIFHCMLSQQRGPKAALMYARAKQRADEKADKEGTSANTNPTTEDTPEASASTDDSTQKKNSRQEVCVLEGGFDSWQSRYGKDARLTADYQPDLWD